MTNWNQSLAKDSHIELIRVIGGGPAGLIFALLNAHEKHKIVIHEKLDLDQLLNQLRALALSASSIDILKKINIDPKGKPVRLMNGQILTIEPGLYFPDDRSVPKVFRNIGIRIEDDVLVNNNHAEVLTSSCPKEIDELESIIGKG